ncbi:MAG TPA: hypothetical protein VEL74_14930 [Thermoanaerobaculia bacterium]|nr:hypothetical protein [Thermoanaerobaculia bacterium]
MKSMLRILSLSAVLASAALTSASASYTGTCRTFCSGSGFTTVTWSATKSRCCSLLGAPCPSGTTATGASWAGSGGLWQFCGPTVE